MNVQNAVIVLAVLAIASCSGPTSVPDKFLEAEKTLDQLQATNDSELSLVQVNCRGDSIDESDVEGVLRASSGLALLTINQFEVVDDTASCGPRSLNVFAKIDESFGTVTHEFNIHLASAGNTARDAVEETPILDPKHIAVGRRYWIAFALHSGFSIPIEAWPEESTIVRKKTLELESSQDFDWNSASNKK